MSPVRRFPLSSLALALAAVLVALGAVWAAPARAYACSCATASDAEHAANAAVVFTGTLVEDEVDRATQTRTLVFAVDRVFKGRATATQVVTSEASGASCGVELTRPGPFLVYAQTDQAGLTANLCGGTRAGSAPVGLGDGQAPEPNAAPSAPALPTDEDPQGGRWIPLVGLVLALTAAAVVGLALIRPRPR